MKEEIIVFFGCFVYLYCWGVEGVCKICDVIQREICVEGGIGFFLGFKFGEKI